MLGKLFRFCNNVLQRWFEFISAASTLLVLEAINHGIPVKGGMAHGLITVNKTKQIFFGQPITDAYKMQEDVYYYGIAAHHTVNSYMTLHLPYISLWTYNVLYKEIPTPLKSGTIEHHNVNWVGLINGASGRNKEKHLILPAYGEIIRELKNKTSGVPRKYIDNTVIAFHRMYSDN